MSGNQFLIGYAVDGPRANVKLSACPGWDGQIALPRQSQDESRMLRTYPGRYVWTYSVTRMGYTWVWEWPTHKKLVDRK